MTRITTTIFSLFLFSQAFAAEWVVTQIDDTGTRPYVALTSEGVPYVVYFQYGYIAGPRYVDSTEIKVGLWDPATDSFSPQQVWVTAPNLQADITMDANDNLHMVYHNHAFGGNPTHSSYDGTEWTHDAIPTSGHDGFSTSIALDANGYPHVGFVDGESVGSPSGPGIEYATYDGSMWVVEAIGSNPQIHHFSGTSISIGRDGLPIIAYHDSVTSSLMIARSLGYGWSIETVDSDGNAGWFPSLDLDSDGFLRVAYLRIDSDTSAAVRLATEGPAGWTLESVDLLEDLDIREQGPESVISLKVGSDDVSYLAYSDTRVVKFASVRESANEIDTIKYNQSPTRLLGQSTSLALDAWDVPHLTFFEHYGDSVGMPIHASMVVISAAEEDHPAPDSEIARVMALHGNYPNPFNPSTTIQFTTIERGQVSLNVYDMSGQLVRVLLNDEIGPGKTSVVWNGRNSEGRRVASGAYIYTMATGSHIESRKLLLMK